MGAYDKGPRKKTEPQRRMKRPVWGRISKDGWGRTRTSPREVAPKAEVGLQTKKKKKKKKMTVGQRGLQKKNHKTKPGNTGGHWSSTGHPQRTARAGGREPVRHEANFALKGMEEDKTGPNTGTWLQMGGSYTGATQNPERKTDWGKEKKSTGDGGSGKVKGTMVTNS